MGRERDGRERGDIKRERSTWTMRERKSERWRERSGEKESES